MKIKTKKQWESEIAARVAAAEAVAEQKLAEAKASHEKELAGAIEIAKLANDNTDEAISLASFYAGKVSEAAALMGAEASEIARLRGLVADMQDTNGKQRNIIGALSSTLSSLRYSSGDAQVVRVLDAVDGFVDLVREGNELIGTDLEEAAREPEYNLPTIATYQSLADDVEDEITEEYDCADLAREMCGRGEETVGETDEERAFLGE